MTMQQLMSTKEVDQWIEKSKESTVIFYKHSFRCSLCGEAIKEMESFAKKHPETPVVWIDVIDSRDVSNFLAEKSAITHQSPQVIFYRNRKPAWNTSHRDITGATLESQLA